MVGNDASLGESYTRAFSTLHEGVKFGNKDAANTLSVAFRAGEPLVDHHIDTARAERYSILGDALWHNPDLRFPNLDKVLPLPPADLPKWDGNKQTLIDAAKALVPLPAVQPTPGSQRTGRAHIPQGHVLLAQAASVIVEPDTQVPYSGYWQPRLYVLYRAHEQTWERAQVPQRYAKGEVFEVVDRSSMGKYANVAPRTVWHYLGKATPATVGPHPRVTQGIARTTRVPEEVLRCKGMLVCPRTGVWAGQVAKEHPLARLYNRWDRFAYVEQGQSFPNPQDQHIAVAPHEVRWLWLDNANRIKASGLTEVSLSDLHSAQDPFKT